MLNRRVFIKGLISAGMGLGSTSLSPFLKTLNGQTTRAEIKGGPLVPKIRVIGLGGCGGKAIDSMIRSGMDGVDFILADRDIRSLNSSPNQHSILLETDLSVIEVRNNESLPSTFKKDKKKIVQALQGSEMVFILAGLGGRTGTFWGPVIAEICSELEIFTVAVITMPLVNGPSQPRRWAEKGMEKLSDIADTVIWFDLDEFDSTLYPENDLKKVNNLAQNKMLEAVKGITGLILSPGLISLDIKDMKSLCFKKGLAAFQIGVAKGPDRARKAVQIAIEGFSGRAFTSQDIRLASFQALLVNYTFGEGHEGGFEEIGKAHELFKKEMDDQATILWGTTIDETLGEEFRASVFVIGGKYEKPPWFKNIFSQFENKNLKLELERLAREMNWTVREGEAFTPDLVAASYFISIVDRNLTGEECWNIFLEFCRETTDDTPLIIVDNLRHLRLPDHKNITFVDLNNPQSFEEIKSAIRKIGV